jgi:hypothetical protein
MKLIFLGLILTMYSSCHSQKQCLAVEIALDKKEFKSLEKKQIKFYIENKNNKEIKLPERLYEGRRNEGDAEFYIEILRQQSKDVYVDVENNDIDYQYVITDRKFKNIKPGNKMEYQTEMNLLHNFETKGIYKVRVVLRLQSLTDCNVVTSAWQKFEIN